MGYVDKTLSKDETLIKKAKIFTLSFLDRYIIAALFILGGIGGLIVSGQEPLEIEEITVSLSSVVMIGVGGVLLVLALLCGCYVLIQKLTRAEADGMLPKAVLARFAGFGLVSVCIGALSYVIAGTDSLCNIMNFALGLVCGLLVAVFAVLRYVNIKLVLTDKRVFGRVNIWRTVSFDVPLDKIDNIIVSFSFWGKMFNYATVTVKSVMGDHKYKYVKSAEEFKNLVMDMKKVNVA